MPENPLISIILLCYNQEKFVGEAIDGVLAQTYSPLEIVIIDDASPDRTAQVIEAKLAAHSGCSNITFVRNPTNLTGVVSCEMGINMTHGRLALVSAGDDIMLPDMVAEIAKVWTTENVSLVTTNAYYIDEHSNSLNRTYRDPSVPGDDSFETLARDGTNACCFGPSIAFEREIYTTFGWPPAYLNAYDIMVPFYAYLLRGARFINKPLIKYRVHSQNTSQSLVAEKSEGVDRLKALERIFFGHLAHSLLMQEELDRLSIRRLERYAELAPRIRPLLTVQTVEMARKLVSARLELDRFASKAP